MTGIEKLEKNKLDYKYIISNIKENTEYNTQVRASASLGWEKIGISKELADLMRLKNKADTF